MNIRTVFCVIEALFLTTFAASTLAQEVTIPDPSLNAAIRVALQKPFGPPVAGLSYDVRIGTKPGGVDLLSPEADLATGWRRVTTLGNLGENLSTTFHPPPGNYPQATNNPQRFYRVRSP